MYGCTRWGLGCQSSISLIFGKAPSMPHESVFVAQPRYLQVPMKVPWFFRILFGTCLYVQILGQRCAHTWPKMCTYFAIYLHYLPEAVLLTFHISISSLRDEVYLLRASKYIFSEKRVFEPVAFGRIDNRQVNSMFYDYLVLYSDYRADIWYYLAHLYIQKIGILVIFLVNFC